MDTAKDMWTIGEAYEAYVGRWSRQVAPAFLRWLDVPVGRHWVDVGCGTGALTEAVMALADPGRVVGIDPAERFLVDARARVADPRVSFRIGDARSLPLPDRQFHAVISGLAVNFVPDQHRAVAEFARVATVDGTVAAYVWDYADGMAMMRHFWDAATTLDPGASELDEGRRFRICQPGPLGELWTGAGLKNVAVRSIDVETVFTSFDDFWTPFLGGQGPAPAYAMALPPHDRDALRDLLRARLPTGRDGTIALAARAWAVRGTAA
jgi:SAM-dependent methyltransferase